jgi:hypothetical protein
MKQLRSSSLTIKSYPKHGPSGCMTIPVYLYSERTLQTLYQWCLIKHSWNQKSRANPPSGNIYPTKIDYCSPIRNKPAYY